VKFSVSLLHKRNPEFVVVRAMAIQNGLALAVIRNSSIHNNILPATVLEELEHGETVLDTIVDDQVVE
jgi:hypothetical protein